MDIKDYLRGQAELELADIEANANTAALQSFAKEARDRLTAYVARNNSGIFQCPHCWMGKAMAADLKGVLHAPSQSKKDDLFQCAVCKTDYCVPSGGISN